jgi:ParB family chromosome partitioning protein
MSDKKETRRGLGRGLSALMADVDLPPNTNRGSDRRVPIEQVAPNLEQPRRHFSRSDLEDLTNSIKAKGVLQPIIVRPKPNSANQFEIVAGERRWRASQAAQLHEIPVIIRDYSDTEMLEVAIIENVQRADLNSIEEASGYRQLMNRFGHTQEKLGEALGKSRSYIANILRLLNLPQDVQDLVAEGMLSAGHARALITSNNPQILADQIIKDGLTVRETERLVKSETQSKAAQKPSKNRKKEKDADTRALESDLSASLGFPVSISHSTSGESGEIVLHYNTLDQLDDICGRLTG